MQLLRKLPIRSALVLLVLFVVFISSIALIHSDHSASQAKESMHTPTPTPIPLPMVYPTFHDLGYPHPIGSDFADFYQKNHGAIWLGQAISPELPNQNGRKQIFTNGILHRGVGTGAVVALPVAQMLISKGAVIDMAHVTSTTTYATLRTASDPAAQVAAPWWWDAGKDPKVAGIFIEQELRQGVGYGHYIPAAFVPFLQSLGDWQTLLGTPVTEIQTDTIYPASGAERISIQGFEHVVLWYNRDTSEAPQIQLQPVGTDYLAISGWPTLTIPHNNAAWTLTPMSIPSHPAANDSVATFLTPFAVQTAGESQWVGHDLWLHVRWNNFLQSRDGWVNVDQLTFQPPSSLPIQIADLDALSPQLMADASAYGYDVTMAVYDPTSGHYYVDNPYVGLEMASMFKIPIIVTLMHKVEQQGRGLTDFEQSEAAAMIEVSDNVAEGALYDEAGDYNGVTGYMNAIGINDIAINNDGIGSTLLSPLSSVWLLDDIRTCRILTPNDCHYILNLMANVVSYQQFGIADTAPAGATWSMKVGYGPGLGGNLADSMGIVTYKGHSYVIAIYTRGNASVPDGTALVDHLCSEAVAAMVGST